jgi:hypothetical protein
MPVPKERVSIGYFTSYYQALKEAFLKFPDIKECHSCLDFDKRK